MREVALELPSVTWADVGGHAAIKQRLKEAVEWPQKHPEMLARMGAKVGLAFFNGNFENDESLMPDRELQCSMHPFVSTLAITCQQKRTLLKISTIKVMIY